MENTFLCINITAKLLVFVLDKEKIHVQALSGDLHVPDFMLWISAADLWVCESNMYTAILLDTLSYDGGLKCMHIPSVRIKGAMCNNFEYLTEMQYDIYNYVVSGV